MNKTRKLNTENSDKVSDKNIDLVSHVDSQEQNQGESGEQLEADIARIPQDSMLSDSGY